MTGTKKKVQISGKNGIVPPLLIHPSNTATTCLTVDASNLAVGGVLEQFLDGNWKPLAFFSRKLDKAQKNYSTFDREVFAIYAAGILVTS